MKSWRPNTQKVYDHYIKKWTAFRDKQTQTLSTNVELSNFLAHLVENGSAYNTINLARSAVSAYENIDQSDQTLGRDPLVCRIVKGAFEDAPSFPQYQETWDVDKVLVLLNIWPEPHLLCLKLLTLRLIMLLALVLC